MDYREEIAGIGDIVGESIAVGSRAKSESNMVDSLLDKERSRIVGELEEKGGFRLNESGSLGVSLSKHEEAGVFERPSFTNADRLNVSFPEQELSSKLREQSDENQTVNEIDGTEENEQGTFPELSATFRLKEERNTESIESCPPIPKVHHHPGNETGEPSVEDGKITKITVPEDLPGKEIEKEDVNKDAPIVVVQPNNEHETVIREKDGATEEPEIITYRGRDLVEEGYRGNLPKVGLQNEAGVMKGEEIGIFSSNEDAQKHVTEGGDETDGQIEGTVDKVDVEVPNEEVAPDILNVKDDSVDGLPSAEVSSLRDKILDEDETLKTSNDDADEINFGDHKEEDVIGNDGLSKDRELTSIETATEETDLPAPGAPSNGDSASHPEDDFAEGDKNEGSEADSAGITREITDQVAIKRDDASPDSNVYTEAIDGDLGNDPFSVPELAQDEFPPNIAEKEAPSISAASNEFNIAGEEDTSSGLTLSGDQTTKDYEEVSSSASSGKVQEKVAEVSTVWAHTVPGRYNVTEDHSVKDDNTGTRKEVETLESTDRDAETDDASDPIKREVPIVADSLGDFVQRETRVIPPEQESLTETSARSSVVENFAEETNASEEALSTLEGQPLDVPGSISEVKHESEESNISNEVHLHAGLSALTDGTIEVSETQTANIPELLAEEKLGVDQRSANLNAEISSAVPVDSNIDGQSTSNEASKYEEVSAAEVVVTESKIPDEEKILKKSFEQLKQDADEIDEDGKHTLTEGKSERELDEVRDIEKVLEDTNTSAGNVLNDTLEKSETEMNTKQPHDMADQGSHSDDQLASDEDPKYEKSSAAKVVTNSMILEEKILARSFDGESEAQIGQDADEEEKYEETAAGKRNSAREHDEVPAREEVPSILDETIVDGVQQRDIANQTDIPLTEATVETTEKATVYDSPIDASTDNQRDISHFGTMTQDQELETNQKRDEPTNDDAAPTLQDGTKIDTQTEEISDITLSETTDEVVSKIQEDDSFGVACELSENPIDGQSAFSEASNYEEASVAEVLVTESKIPEETATEEQLRQDTDEIDNARELNEVPNREVLEATNVSPGNTPYEKFEQLKTEVSGEQPHDMADQGDVALTEVSGEPIKKDGVDMTIPLVDQKDGRGDDQLASKEDPKHGESSVAEVVTESEILEEKILMRSFNDGLEAQIGQDADEVEKYRETALGEGNTVREHNEVPALEQVPSVLDETIVDGVQQQDITNQTDIELIEATGETTEKAVVYDSATDACTNDQRDISHFGTMTQDQKLKTNKKQDEPTNDDAASTCWDYAKIDTQTEETYDMTLSETTDEVASKIQEDDSFGVAGEVLENPIEDSAILPDETIKSEEISGERQDVEEPALGQGDKGSSLVDDNINDNERGIVGSSEFMDAADSVQEIKEDGLQTEDVNKPLPVTGITEDKDPTDIVEKDLIDGTGSDEKIDAGEDKEAREPYEEIPHPEQRDLLVDITEADYDRVTSSTIPSDTQELSTLEGDIQKDDACIKNKVEASENEGIRGLPHKDQQENAQGILAEEIDLEGEIASKDVETDHIVQEDKKGNKEDENSREANEDEINTDGEVDMESSTINEESLATVAPAIEMAADNSHVEEIEGEKWDLNLSNEIAEEGDSYSAGAGTPFSERSISDTQPGMSSENFDGANAVELNASVQSVEDVIAMEVSDETALADTPIETTTTLQTQPPDHSYEQDPLESAPADGSTIEFNRENEQDGQDKTSDEKSSRVEVDNLEHGTDTPTRDVPATAENVEINLAEMNEQTTGSSDVGEQKILEEAFFQVDNSLPPEAEVVGIESNEVLQNEAETTEGGSAEEAPQLGHYTEISSDGPPDEMFAFSTSVPNDVQEREIGEIVASEDDQTRRTIQEVSEHTDVDGVASADAEADLVKTAQPTRNTGNLEESIAETSVTVMPDENDDSNEESFIVENQITSEQILESTDQQIEPILSREAVQEDSDVVESSPVGESTLDENPLLRASEKESESEGIQSSSMKEAWSDGKELTLQTDISQDELDIGISKYADKERDVTETEEITPLELGDRGFASAVQTKEISTDEEASKIKEVVSEDASESIDDAIGEVIPVTSDTQPSMSSEYLDGENAGELNPTAVSVEDGSCEEEDTDAGIEEASEALVDSKGHEEQATGQRELINVTEVSNEAALSDVPDETAATIQTVPADDLYDRNSVENTEESKVHVESATADGFTIECYGNTEQDIEDKTSNEQTSQDEIDNRDLAADMPTRDAVAGGVKPTEPTESTGNLENESIGEMSETVMPDENDNSKEESFVELIPHEEAVIAETEDVEPVSVGESTLDQSPLADVLREESTLLHAQTEAWSDGNESMLQSDVRQDESDTSMSKFADNERDAQESENITPFELGNRDFTSGVQTKEVLTEEDTPKIKEVVSEGAGESVNDAIGEVIQMTSDTQPSMSGEYLGSENVEELNSAALLVKDIASKEESTDAGIEETSEALINSNGHEVEASGQRDLINATEVSDEAALLDAPNETVATMQTVPTADDSAMEFYRENEQGVQDKTFNERASQVEIDNQDLAADMLTMDVPATVENVKIDRAKLDELTDGIGSSLPPEAETGGNERNQVLQNEAETKEEFSGEEALQSMEISSDGPSDQMSAFSTSVPDHVQERERHKILVSEDDQTSRTLEELDDESQNKVEQEDNAEKVEQEFTLNEERPANGESVEATISSDQLTQSGGKESNGSLGDENISEVIKDVYADVGGVPTADAEADIAKLTQPTQITGNLVEESIEKMSATVTPDENYDSEERSFFEPVPHEEATLVETEEVEPPSVGESTLEQDPSSDVSQDESTLLHAQTEAWPDGNERMLQTGVRQDESDAGMLKYAKEIDVPATGKIAPLELGDRDFSSAVPTKEILTEEDASKNEEVESVDVAADHTKEQPSVTTEDTILKDKEVRDDTQHAAGKPEDMIETYEDKTSAAASVVNAETTIPRGNEAAAEVGESLDDAIEEVTPMTSDSSSAVPKEGEMLASETEHEKENASLEISQRNLTDTDDLKDININEMAADILITDGQGATGSVSDLPKGSIDAITAASVDQESASLTLPSEETVADKAWTRRESPEDEHLELGFKQTGTGDDTAEKYGESRSLDFTSVQADQETKNEINGGEILSDGYGADKANYGLASEAVEIADKVDPSLKEKEEKAFDEAQILPEKASQKQDEYKQGAADKDKAPILSDANDPVEGTVDCSPPEEAEGQTFDSVEGDRKMETPVPTSQGSGEEVFEGDRTPALEESKGLNQVIASKEDPPTAYHDSGLPRDASLVKEVTANLSGSTERGLSPAEAREFRDQSEVNLDSKEFEGEKFSTDTTTVPQTPVADNLQLPEQSPIIQPDENEEHEDEDNDHEHIEHSDAAPLMVESAKDVVDGKALHKKSHNNLLSGMSSKVKSSISRVKKVITGKSSNHNKEHSPKHGQ